MNKVRVFLADDHHIVITGLCDVFEDFNSDAKDGRLIEIAGRAASAADLLSNAGRDDVDVFITDLGFAGTRGDISIVKEILQIRADAKIVIFSMRCNINTIVGCYRAGVKAYVTKSDDVQRLIEAVFLAADNKDYFAPGILSQIGLMSLRDPLSCLAEREAKIFLLLAQNVDIEAVQEELGISEKTINNIVSNKIKPVLGVSRKDFRSLAIKMGLIDDLE